MSLQTHQIIQKPLITEESQIQATKTGGNQYTFRVHPDANKQMIRNAVESIFKDVKVVRVNTMNYTGKLGTRMSARRPGRKPNWKKAIVTLREGDTIDLI